MNKNHKNKRKGFTLLEILLVIAAIGILAAIVLVSINPTRQINQVRQAGINSERNAIEKALQQILIDTGSYPSSIEGVQKEVCATGAEQVGGLTDCNGKADLRVLIPDYIAAIPSSTTYTVARGNNGRSYVNTTETAANLSCPTGYIKVPGNSLYQTKDFCVMKYEAKAVDINKPTVGLLTPNTGFNTIDNIDTATTSANGRAIASVASGYPIARITQTTAIDYCANQNTVSGASLITNAEWMTIARNIEAQNSNWFNTATPTVNQVGSGGLWRGHSDNSQDNVLVASTDDNLGYVNTNNSPNSANGWSGWQERRTYTLSNGETIWDLSGNVWELINDTILGKDQPTGSSPGATSREYNTGLSNSITNFGTLGRDLVGPSNPDWNSTQNMGQIYNDGINSPNQTFALHRGGGRGSAISAGVFAMILSYAPSTRGSIIGFRCVLR